MKTIGGYFVLTALLFSPTSFAVESSSSSSPKSKSIDLSHMMKKPEPLPGKNAGAIKVGITCKTTSGAEIRSNETGFDDCMKNSASKAADKNKK